MLQSSLTPEQAAILAAIWLILLGAAATPVLIVLARLGLRLAAHVTLAVLLKELSKWTGIPLAAALGIAFATPPPAAATETPARDIRGSQVHGPVEARRLHA
jgi:hypothetical protein